MILRCGEPSHPFSPFFGFPWKPSSAFLNMGPGRCYFSVWLMPVSTWQEAAWSFLQGTTTSGPSQGSSSTAPPGRAGILTSWCWFPVFIVRRAFTAPCPNPLWPSLSFAISDATFGAETLPCFGRAVPQRRHQTFTKYSLPFLHHFAIPYLFIYLFVAIGVMVKPSPSPNLHTARSWGAFF